MPANPIDSLDTLHEFLVHAMQLEHATIPAYMTALYSIHPDSNPDASNVIRVVLVEEMLHLTLAANLMNATGGSVDLTIDGFLPAFPTYLPDGETDFQVSLRPFSKAAVEGFCKIERPARAPEGHEGLVTRDRPANAMGRVASMEDGTHFYSIGEFYAAIERGIEALETKAQATGGTIFTGDPSWQIGPEYYYSGGGKLTEVTDLASAKKACELIMGQGEAAFGHIFDSDGEIAHYYRFQQLLLGRYYQHNDQPDHPTGAEFTVDWDAAYPCKVDVRRDDLAADPELLAAADAFDALYAEFLGFLSQALGGEPKKFYDAIGYMFRIKDALGRLVKNPLPGSSTLHAAPTFVVSPPVTGAPS